MRDPPTRTELTVVWVMALGIACAGCTHQIRPMPSMQATSGERLALRAKYYIAPQERAKVHSDSYFALGKAHTWNVEIGEALSSSFPQMLRSLFVTVAQASGPDDLSDADVLLIPSISQFEIGGGDFVSTIQVRVRGLDHSRNVATDEVFLGNPREGKAATAWWGGVFAGSETLQRSAEYAFEDVLPKIQAHLRMILSSWRPAA